MTRITADWLDAPATRAVCAMLTGAGHQAWFVGGCVRDALLGREVLDLDIATDARPARVVALAAAAGLRSVPTGLEHGTITVIAQDTPFEVTTFRRDVETDGRHAVVAFADTLDEDAHRRDFTFNALYAAPDGTVRDPLGGLADLAARRVRFIDDAKTRIREDYLRILRFFRFHAWYGDPLGGLDAEGLAACAQLAAGLERLARERVGHEILRLLAAPDPAPSVAAMAACGALWRVLPGAGAATLTVLVHMEQVLGLAPDRVRRLAALGGQDPAGALRLSKAQSRQLARLTGAAQTGTGAAELGYRLGVDEAHSVIALRAAMAGQEPDPGALQLARDGAGHRFPLRAADLADRHTGRQLGEALRQAEARWIASGFRLGRKDLLA